MWNHRSGWFGFDGGGKQRISRRSNDEFEEREWRSVAANANTPEDVFGEVGLVLVVVLGIVLAINALLVVLHVT